MSPFKNINALRVMFLQGVVQSVSPPRPQTRQLIPARLSHGVPHWLCIGAAMEHWTALAGVTGFYVHANQSVICNAFSHVIGRSTFNEHWPTLFPGSKGFHGQRARPEGAASHYRWVKRFLAWCFMSYKQINLTPDVLYFSATVTFHQGPLTTRFT